MSRIHHARLPNGQCECCQNASTDPAELVELSGSVGEGGSNRPDDTAAVQARLNRVTSASGGPVEPLDVDGKCGPITKAAILRFQRRYPRELLSDGRIDVGKNTWKKLVALSDGGGAAPLPKAPAVPSSTTPSNADSLLLLNAALLLSRHRIYEAIRALDICSQELTACEAKTWFHVGARPMTLLQAFTELKGNLKELPTLDRCFHVIGPKSTAGHVRDTIRRVRKVYTDMIEVIIRNSITTPADEKTGVRRFIRLVSDNYMKKTYPPKGAIASAPEGGWWSKNANVDHIRFNSSMVDRGDVITSLIHEMSHFVSHASSYSIGNHHSKGMYNGAFNDTHEQAVRNSFCYEWYSFLASFKHQRSTPNASLVLT